MRKSIVHICIYINADTVEYYSSLGKNKTVTSRKTDVTRDHHGKKNKPDTERKISCFLSYV